MSKSNNNKPAQNGAAKKIDTGKLVAYILAACVCVIAVVILVTSLNRDNAPSTPSTPTQDNSQLIAAIQDTTALKVNGYDISALMLNYFYVDAINEFCNQYGNYISYVLDVSKPLNEQVYDKETGETWADIFLEMATSNLKSTYTIYDLAVSEGVALGTEEIAYLDNMMTQLATYAPYYGYKDVDAYLTGLYGLGASQESFRGYFEIVMLADLYYNQYAEKLTYDDAALREYEADKSHMYNAYNYSVYYLSAEKFLTGGTEGEDGKITYTDEEKAAAVNACKAAAEALAAGTFATIEEFDAAIKALEVNANLQSVASTLHKEEQYSKVAATFKEWVCSADRISGETTAIAKTSGTGDSQVTNGYYVVRFDSIYDNHFVLKNVRHILVLFEGGKTDSSGNTTYTDEEKAAAKKKAEELLAKWEAGDKTEDSFATLAMKESDDGSKASGGLYTNIYPGQMVESFEKWCYDESRQPGDTGLVESIYGWHVMFFSGNSETTFRDFMIAEDKRSEDLSAWHKDLVEKATLEIITLEYVELDMVLYG